MPGDETTPLFFFFNDTATTEIYTLSLHDALPIYVFRTENYGKSWKLLTDGENGIPADHFVRVVREEIGRAHV